jgi:DNA-binding transcriptional LysR family regulator
MNTFMTHISSRQLMAFVALAEANNFRRAAEHLHISSSTVSNLITELEDCIEFPLFIRTTRKRKLKQSGLN